MGTNEKDEIESKVAGNDAMDVDCAEVGEKAPLGQEGAQADNSHKMEVDEERPPVSYDENLEGKKEEGKDSVEIETGDGKNQDVNYSVDEDGGKAEAEPLLDSVPNQSPEEKGSDEAPLSNITNQSPEEKGSDEVPLSNVSKNGGSPSLESQMEGSVLPEERDKKPSESSNVGAKKEDSAKHESDKDENTVKLGNDADRLEAPVPNGIRKEELSNELNSWSDSKEEESKREVEIAKVVEPKRELSVTRLVVHEVTKREPTSEVKERLGKPDFDRVAETDVRAPLPVRSFLGNPDVDGYESGTEEEQREFSHELDVFYKERDIDFRPPKFYQEQLNLLKLWRWVIKLGGYEQVTSCKLWRQIGEAFRPPKTCTTVSWTFRGFYEKTLLAYEKQKFARGELPEIDRSVTDSMVPGSQVAVGQSSGSGRARRDSAARAMQGWHSLRVSNNGEVGDPIVKDKNCMSLGKRERQLKSIASLKRPKQSPVENVVKVGHLKSPKPQSETMVVDAGPPADWVKINVHRTKDCYEVYALVPGLLREEVRVQSDPAGRLVISGQPEQLDNPWGITPFKKIVSLPTRIDPHQTSAVVTLHGQLFVRVPFEQSDN
ncbi:DNA-binding transcription factor [Lithospermum erythrorhizon]|uniref:DNA-binding transcription factor n=1 Tax=Lithospermum erythrorhizon TaxID=34254 RepID=A0AAV3PL19_LITER